MSTEEIVAFNAYRSFGISNDDKFLENSIVYNLNNVSGDYKISYTENYFYEEAMFKMYLLFEAETRFGYINYLINKFISDGDIFEVPDYRELGMVFTEYAYFLSSKRMTFAGITQCIDKEEVLDFCISRSSEYAKLMNNSIACTDPVEEPAFDFADPKEDDHPHNTYMKTISRNISNSLGIENELQKITLYQLVKVTWLAHMEIGSKYSS